MKVSALFSVFLAAVSLGVTASPIANYEADHGIAVRDDGNSTSQHVSFDLAKRGSLPTAAFTEIAKYHDNLEHDRYYVFRSVWPLREEADKTTPAEIQTLQKELGFYHIGLIIGKVTITTKPGVGPNKGKTVTTKSFDAKEHHTVKEKNGDIMYSNEAWEIGKKRTITFLKPTTKKKFDALINKGKQYVKDNKKYSVVDNNCNTFVEEMLKEL